jgi:predicted HTH domain antitoxin
LVYFRIIMELTLKISSQIAEAIKLPEHQKEPQLFIELAVILYQQSILSFGKARELANLSKWDFDAELAKRKIERHYEQEDLQNDLDYGKS